MESRRIQKVGAGTLTLSLPREWADRRHLRKGDALFLVPEGDELRVVPAESTRSPSPPPQTYVVDADLCDEPGLLERVIVGNYILGRKKIIVRSKRRLAPEHVREARWASRRLLGLAITEQTATHITLQCALDPAHYPLDRLIRRLQELGATMLLEAIEALVTRDRGLAEDVADREDEADTLSWLILRHLLSAQVDDALLADLGLPSRLSLMQYRMVTRDLEAVADCCESLAQAVLVLLERDAEIGSAFAKQLREYADVAIHALRGVVDALLEGQLESLAPIFRREDELARREDELVRLKLKSYDDPRDILPLRTVLRSVRQIGTYVESIAVVVVNHHLGHADRQKIVAPIEEPVEVVTRRPR